MKPIDRIMRDLCELTPAQIEHNDTIAVSTADVENIINRHLSGNWISVKDRLPEGKVLVCYLEPFFGLMTQEIGVGYYDNPDDYEDGSGDGWLFWRDDKKIVGGGVTHWMELPEMPPKDATGGANG